MATSIISQSILGVKYLPIPGLSTTTVLQQIKEDICGIFASEKLPWYLTLELCESVQGVECGKDGVVFSGMQKYMFACDKETDYETQLDTFLVEIASLVKNTKEGCWFVVYESYGGPVELDLFRKMMDAAKRVSIMIKETPEYQDALMEVGLSND